VFGILSDIIIGFTFNNDIKSDSYRLFIRYGMDDIAEHYFKVAQEAKQLSIQFGIYQDSVEITGYLHDISRIISHNEYHYVVARLGIEVLNAIECHSTLRENANKIDLILFIADKLSWDSADCEPILYGINRGWRFLWNIGHIHI